MYMCTNTHGYVNVKGEKKEDCTQLKCPKNTCTHGMININVCKYS